MPNSDTQQRNKGGRPRKFVDFEMVKKLATIGCTHEEIAYALSVSVDTLTRRKGFAEAYKKGDSTGKQSIRHRQHQAGLSGNVAMLIWLGKVRLGQKDVVSNEHSGNVTVNDGAKDKLISKLNPILTAESDHSSDPVIN